MDTCSSSRYNINKRQPREAYRMNLKLNSFHQSSLPPSLPPTVDPMAPKNARDDADRHVVLRQLGYLVSAPQSDVTQLRMSAPHVSCVSRGVCVTVCSRSVSGPLGQTAQSHTHMPQAPERRAWEAHTAASVYVCGACAVHAYYRKSLNGFSVNVKARCRG